ncbi:hypothetical protein GGR54DRAFT_303692 [Hypoxylon sp. NC1633]|nr:hypothetical protein GGR54DRAFT_303692 [Hypoxylon sp. NC1633]
MAPLKALIVGGGVVGPAVAHWLARIGAHVTLIERFPKMRASGQQVDLRAQGVTMMKKMGIEEAVRAVLVHEPGMQVIDLHGQTKAYFPAAESGTGKQGITSEFEIMRGDLVRVLYALTEGNPKVEHLYATTVESFTQDDENDPNGKVHVTFQDGRKEDFDLVVGADGTGSKLRKMMLGPDAPDPRRRTGGYIGYFSIPSKPEDSKRATFCFLPGKFSRIIGTRKDCPELTRVYMVTKGKIEPLDAAYATGNPTDLKKALAALYQDGGWETKRFMDALLHAPEADDLYFTPFEEVDISKGSWSKGRVVVVGDAAYSQTAAGYGCTWGLVGAYVLAGEVATLLETDGLSPSAAVVQGAKNYEERLRPIATANHGDHSELFDWIFFPSSAIGIWILQMCLKVAAYFHLDRMGGMDSKTANWQLPSYPALDRDRIER